VSGSGSTDRSVHIRITGRVQGVSFRLWAQRRATSLRLSGWVRNCRDGSVEAVLSGPAEAVAAMLAACRTGPPGARVDMVEEIGPAEPQTGAFRIVNDL